jgi:hypothetical protein
VVGRLDKDLLGSKGEGKVEESCGVELEGDGSGLDVVGRLLLCKDEEGGWGDLGGPDGRGVFDFERW